MGSIPVIPVNDSSFVPASRNVVAAAGSLDAVMDVPSGDTEIQAAKTVNANVKCLDVTPML